MSKYSFIEIDRLKKHVINYEQFKKYDQKMLKTALVMAEFRLSEKDEKAKWQIKEKCSNLSAIFVCLFLFIEDILC